MPKARKRRSKYSARTADRHALYERAVQEVEAEIDFVDEQFRALRKRRASRLREDFCGTANTSCEWVRRRPDNTVVGLDLDAATLAWGREHHLSTLTNSQQRRITLLQRNVLTPGPEGSRMDAVLAMNFSYFCFKTRALLGNYFRAVHASLAREGVFFMDYAGGWECMKDHQEIRPCGGFNYIWRAKHFDPITHDIRCSISFTFPDGTRLPNAFTYDWRFWTIPEIRELLAEAGFTRSIVYWEGDDNKGGGNGVFTPAEHGEACASFISYIVGVK